MKDKEIKIPLELFNLIAEYHLKCPTAERKDQLQTEIEQGLKSKITANSKRFVYGMIFETNDPDEKKKRYGLYRDLKNCTQLRK